MKAGDLVTLVAELAQRGHIFSLAPGAAFNAELPLEGGELVAEVYVKIRRRVARDKEAAYREAALAYLREHPSITLSACRASTTTRSPWSTSSYKDCSKPIGFAIAREGTCTIDAAGKLDDARPQPLRFRFVCAAHREIEGKDTLAVVSLPKGDIAKIRKEAERRDAERREAERRQEAAQLEEQRQAAARRRDELRNADIVDLAERWGRA